MIMKYDYKNPPEKTLRFWLNCIASQLFVEPRDMAKWVREKEKCCSKVFSTTEMTLIEENKKEVNIDAEVILDYSFLYYTEHLENYEKDLYSSTLVLFSTLKGLEEYKKECINDTGVFVELVLHNAVLLPFKEGDQFEDGTRLYHTNMDRGINGYYPPDDTFPFVEFEIFEVYKNNRGYDYDSSFEVIRGNRIYDYDNSLAAIQLRLNEELEFVVTEEDRNIRMGSVIENLKYMSNFKIRKGTEYIDFKIRLCNEEKEILIYKGEIIRDDGFEIVNSFGVEILEK